MDLGSPDRSVEEYKGDDGASVAETPDPNMLHNKIQPVDEAVNGMVQADSNMEHSESIVLPVGVNDEGLPFSITKSSSPDPSPPSDRSEEQRLPIESYLDRDDADKRSYYYTEPLKSPMDEYNTCNEKEGTEYVGISSEFLDTNTNENVNEKVETEPLKPSTDKSLQKLDDIHACEVADDKDIDHQTANSPTSNELLNGDSGNIEDHSNSGKDELVRVEMAGRIDSEYIEIKEDNCPTGILSSHNGGAEGEYCVEQSPQRTLNAAPSPERPLFVSPAMSPRTKYSARHEEPLSPANNDLKRKISLSPSKRKRSSSPEKQNVSRKRASSRDRSSPSLRRRSPSDRTTQRNSHRRGDSPRKRLSASPRRRDSPQKRDRSASRSPVRRRDSSGQRRDHRGRSRSRSPYSRDRHRRSPRRRPSPRRRSPPSGHHSRRRPWSPPANRNTGIGRPGNNLFVAGFSYGTTERDLEKKFSRYGRVTDVRVVREKRTGDSRGFGFLSMETDEDADAAIRALDQTEWNGRIVLVEKSKTALR